MEDLIGIYEDGHEYTIHTDLYDLLEAKLGVLVTEILRDWKKGPSYK